ncbi:MAG: glycosyltransferase [Myxococcales bacterium]|nr:glycosyltransferase [Myxococcales bacterium]
MDEIVCVDTGSTDDTVAVAERFGARVLHSPWRGAILLHLDEALEASTCDWVLLIDPDEWLTNPPDLRPTVEAAAAAAVYTLDALLVHVDTMADDLAPNADGRPGVRSWSARLLRRRGARDGCPVHHELRIVRGVGISPLTLRSDYSRTVEDELARSIPLLHRMLEAGTDDARAHFDLTNAYFVAGRLDVALKHARAAEPLVGDDTQYAPLWIWMFWTTLSVEGLAPARDALRRGLERHPDCAELHRIAITSALLRPNGAGGANQQIEDANDGLDWNRFTVDIADLADPSELSMGVSAAAGPSWVRLTFDPTGQGVLVDATVPPDGTTQR